MPTRRKPPPRKPLPGEAACCSVESIVTVDERGQMVLPKELRERAGIKAGDKLAVTTWQQNGVVCCIALIKAESLQDMVKDVVGPVMKDVLASGRLP